ncbi:MAG: NAD(P)H-dependent oxidoreductase, partial [Acidimicrobiia bacterium]
MAAATMRALIVHAHPVADSFNHAVVRAATAGLEAAGHQVTALDLYAADYRAVMNASEWQVYESESPVVDPIVAAHVDLVRSSEALIFVYPTWW